MEARTKCNFAYHILKYIFFNESHYIVIEISLKFVPKCAIDNKQELFQVMAWHWASYYLGQCGPSFVAYIYIYVFVNVYIYIYMCVCVINEIDSLYVNKLYVDNPHQINNSCKLGIYLILS